MVGESGKGDIESKGFHALKAGGEFRNSYKPYQETAVLRTYSANGFSSAGMDPGLWGIAAG